MKPNTQLVSIVSSLAFSAGAAAEFVSFNFNTYTAGNFCVADFYACFNHPDDEVLNIF